MARNHGLKFFAATLSLVFIALILLRSAPPMPAVSRPAAASKKTEAPLQASPARASRIAPRAPVEQVRPSSAPAEPAPGAPDLYVARGGEHVATIARAFLARTSYMTVAELVAAIRDRKSTRLNSSHRL